MTTIEPRRPVRALFLSHDSKLYGAQRSLLSLLEHLDRRRVEPVVVAPAEGPLTASIAARGIPVRIVRLHHWVAVRGKRQEPWIRRAWRVWDGIGERVSSVRRVLDEFRVEVVYTNTVTVIEGALAARAAGLPHVWHLREQVAGNSQLTSLLPPRMVEWAVALLSRRRIFNSHHLREGYACKWAGGAETVVHNGIDPEEFRVDRSRAAVELRSELGLAQDCRLISIVGSVIPLKNQALLVEAARELAAMCPDFACLVVGEGEPPYLRFLNRRIAALGLGPRFHFLGLRNDIPRILGATDVLIIAADEEAFGRTAIEAMAAGTPVVSTRCGGPEEVIIDGVCGLLVPRNDAGAMAGAIATLLRDGELAGRLRSNACARVGERFCVEAYAAQIQDEIEAAVSGSSACSAENLARGC